MAPATNSQDVEQEDPAVYIGETEFRFRENKEKYKRPTLTLNVPYPSADYLIQVLQAGEDNKVRSAVVDAINGIVVNYLRGKVNEKEDFSQEDLDELVAKGQLSLETIATLPRSERNTITNADLATFGKVFIDVAAEVENDPELRVASQAGAQVAAATFADRLRSAAGKNDVLDRLQLMLEKFCNAANEEILQEHNAIIEWLYVKLEEAKKKDELTLDNLD